MLRSVPESPLRFAEEQALDRRRLLKLAGAATVAALGAEWLATRRGFGPPALGGAVHVRDLGTLAPGATRAVADGAGGEVLVARLDDASVVAFERRCPHLGCPVVYAAARGRFECPCHHAAFDPRTGRVLFGPPRRGLTPVEVLA